MADIPCTGKPTNAADGCRVGPICGKDLHGRRNHRIRRPTGWQRASVEAVQLGHDERRLVAQYQQMSNIQSLSCSPSDSSKTESAHPMDACQEDLPKLKPGHRARAMADPKEILGIVTPHYSNISLCYADIHKNVWVSLLLSCLGIACGCVVNELETNWWFLDPEKLLEGEYEIYYHNILLGSKITGVVLAFCLVLANIRYHVLMFVREISANDQLGSILSVSINAQHFPKVWDIPETRSRVFWQTIAILVVQIPKIDGRISVTGFPCGLSYLDPEGKYFYDTFLFFVLMAVRCCFLGRLVHVYQDLFSPEGDHMTVMTKTKASYSLAIRTLLSRRPVASSIAIPVAYFMVIAYVHNKIEGSVVNVWPADRSCDSTASFCVQIWASEHPVTFLNSLWMHFVAASTIGFGEYTTHTHLGRLLLSMSYYIALCLNSFIVFVVFKTLPLSKMERTVTGRVYRRHINKQLQREAAVLLQSVVRSRRAVQHVKVLSKIPWKRQLKVVPALAPSVDPPQKQGSFVAASNAMKLLSARRIAGTCAKKLNVALLRWRRARARVNSQLADNPALDVEAAGAVIILKANQIQADVERALVGLEKLHLASVVGHDDANESNGDSDEERGMP